MCACVRVHDVREVCVRVCVCVCVCVQVVCLVTKCRMVTSKPQSNMQWEYHGNCPKSGGGVTILAPTDVETLLRWES